MTVNNLLIASFYHFDVNLVFNLSFHSVFPFIDFSSWCLLSLFCCAVQFPSVSHFGEKNLKCVQRNSYFLLFITFDYAVVTLSSPCEQLKVSTLATAS